MFQHFITLLNPLFSPFGVEFDGKREQKKPGYVQNAGVYSSLWRSE
jgi:hypothetical protein